MEELTVVERTAILALQIAVVLFAARVCGKLAEKIKIPSVLGELLAGILIGSCFLGKIPLPFHGLEHGLFGDVPGVINPPLYMFATIGSVVLLFMSGLETDLRMFFRYSVAGLVVGLGGVIFSFVLGDALGMIMFEGASFMDPRCLFMGILSTATSVGITARILSEKKKIDSPEGTTILAAAVIDDVLGIICLAVVTGIVGAQSTGNEVSMMEIGWITVKSVGIWLGATAVGLLIAHKIAWVLKKFQPAAVYSVMALALALLVAGLFEQAKLAMIVGAYVMGLCLSKTDISFELQRQLHTIYNFLVPVFFVVMGMMINVKVFTNMDVLTYGLIFAALAVIAKVVGCALPSLFLNFNMVGALRIGMGMIPRGEVALIIAALGVSMAILDEKLFGIAIIMTLVTTVVAPPLLAVMLNVQKKGVRKDVADLNTVQTPVPPCAPAVHEIVMETICKGFRDEGFFHSELGKGTGVTHFRRGETAFSLVRNGNEAVFESSPVERQVILPVLHEAFASLRSEILRLGELPDPGNLSDAVLVEENAEVEKLPMQISQILSRDSIILDLKAGDFDGVIKELCERINEKTPLLDVELCKADTLEREKVVTTCIPGGIALPHARTEGVDSFVSVVGISKEGIMGTNDEKINIFILSLCPKDAPTPYLEYLSRIANILAKKENFNTILSLDNPEHIRAILIAE